MKHAIELQKDGREQDAEAEGQRAQDQWFDARDRYLSARADLSRDPEVLIEFAEFVEKLGDSDLAGEAYLRAAGLRPEDARLWYRAGRNFADAGGRYLIRAAEPLDRAEALTRTTPGTVTRAEIETTRGDISWKYGAYEIAAKRYAAALAADAAGVRAQIGAACAALALGDPARAEASLDKLQTIPPADAAVLAARLREAYLAFRRMNMRPLESATAYRALAGVAVRAGFIADARAAIEHALTLDDRDVFSWNMEGSLAEAAGDTARARRAYTRSLELQPDQPRTLEALARLAGAGPPPGPAK
jgi:tetratricopeptide (TPR) repeat protein